jgi:hypothetical protein
VAPEHDHETAGAEAAAVRAAAAQAPGETTAAERVMSLQRSVGNRAVSRLLAAGRPRQLARWNIPLQGGVPAGTKHVTSLADFVDIIRAVEGTFPAHEQTNTKLMITRLRKLFYGTKGWDDELIPGAKGIAPVYTLTEVEDGRRDWGGSPSSLEMVDKHYELAVPSSASATLRKLVKPGEVQEVLMPNGDFVDVGHVFAGLDAMNFPTGVSAPFGSYKISSNVDAVTWIGDLGSILAEWVFQRMDKGRVLTSAEAQAQVDLMAPVQDMLGNVDAYAIGDAYSIGSAAGKKVSDILLEYYGAGGVATAAGLAARSKRFTTFASKIGLGPLSGGTFGGEAAWLTKYEDEVGNAAALYAGAGTHVKTYVNPYGWGGLAGLMSGISTNPGRRYILDAFLAQLKAKVAAEAAAAAPRPTPAPVP